VQHLFSAEGDVNEELLTLALLKAMGPERYYDARPASAETWSPLPLEQNRELAPVVTA
jgi:hypothetical protein